MAGRRELLEAAAYERRRLLTALVAGRLEAEPARPGRVVVAGVALAALTVAGAALAGVLAPGTPVDWTRPGLVVSRETGAAYVVLDAGPPVLHPVANATAARLVLGSAHAPTVVPERDIAGRRIGAEVGVAGAPASLPAVDRLVDSGWTACTEDGAGVRLRIAQPPAVRAAPAAGLVVRSGGRAFLLAPAGVAGAGPAGGPPLRAAPGARCPRRQPGQPAGRPGAGHPRRRARGAPRLAGPLPGGRSSGPHDVPGADARLAAAVRRGPRRAAGRPGR